MRCARPWPTLVTARETVLEAVQGPARLRDRLICIVRAVTAEVPGEQPRTGPLTSWIRRIAVGATIVIAIVLVVSFGALPDSVPTHFTLLGEADSYGPKLALLPPPVLICLLSLGLGWLSSRPLEIVTRIRMTAINEEAVAREAERLLVWCQAGLVVGLIRTTWAVATRVPCGRGSLAACGLTATLVLSVSAREARGGCSTAPSSPPPRWHAAGRRRGCSR